MKNLMICGNAKNALRLNESESTSDRYILEGLFAGPFGVENRNKRIYQADEYLKHLQYLRDDIKKGEALLGELDHPDDRFEVKMKEVSHRILDLWYDKDSNTIQGKLELLNTPNGKLAQSLVDQGVPLHISSRAAGSVNSDKSVSIQQIYTFDLVCKPGFAGAVLHRVNESEGSQSYSSDVYDFLKESERAEANNTAPQFGMLNEDITITEVSSDVNLREEAKNITENNNADDMIKKEMNVSEEDVKQNKTHLYEGDDEEKDDAKQTEDNGDNENDNDDDNDSDSDEKKDDEGVEIISVRADVEGDEEDSSDDVEIKDVKSDDDKDDDKDGDEDEKKEDSSDEDEKKEDDASEEVTDECDKKTDECGTAEKKAVDIDDKEKEMLLDCKEIKCRKEKFEEKIDDLIDSIKSKGDKKKADESHTINQYPLSRLLNESNFAGFMGLNEAQKNNVITFLEDNKMFNIESVNENWKQGINY